VFVEGIEVESLGIVGIAKPLEQFLAFGMFRVGHGFDQVFVAGNTAAVFGRAGAGAVQACDDFVGDPRKKFSTRTSCSQLSPKSYS
jgi:hypothetical protein